MKRARLIIYLAALSALAAFSTDIYLASMPVIQTLFHTSASNIQLTLSLFFIAFAFLQLVWGPLSDRLGRRTVIFIGIGVFTLGSLLSAFSHSITELIIARIIQAAGACSGIVCAFAIVKDTFSNHNQITQALSSITVTLMISPMLAPILGSYLLSHINWQANFDFLALGGLILLTCNIFFKETHLKHKRKPLPANQIKKAYLEQIKHGPFLLATLATAASFSVMFSFVSSSSFVYINLYHIAPKHFGYYFSLNAIGLMLGTASLKLLKGKIRDSSLIIVGLICTAVGGIAMVMCLQLKPASIWSIAIPSFVATYGAGLLFPETNSCALKHVLAYNGLASSLIGTTRFILAAIVGYIMGLTTSHSAMPLAISIITLSIATAFLMLVYFQQQKLKPAS